MSCLKVDSYNSQSISTQFVKTCWKQQLSVILMRSALVTGMFELTEWRLQRDAAQLLTLLLYADFVLSSAAAVSLPQLVTESLSLPFPSQPHWTVSPNTTTSMKGEFPILCWEVNGSLKWLIYHPTVFIRSVKKIGVNLVFSYPRSISIKLAGRYLRT